MIRSFLVLIFAKLVIGEIVCLEGDESKLLVCKRCMLDYQWERNCYTYSKQCTKRHKRFSKWNFSADFLQSDGLDSVSKRSHGWNAALPHAQMSNIVAYRLPQE